MNFRHVWVSALGLGVACVSPDAARVSPGHTEVPRPPARVVSAAPPAADCTPVITSVVRAAKMPLRVDAYMSGGFAKVEALGDAMRRLLTSTHESSPSQFVYEINPPAANAREAERVGLLFDGAYGTDDTVTPRPYRMGLEIHYGPSTVDIRRIDLDIPWPTFEFLVATEIRNVVATVDAAKPDTIGVVAPRSELRFDARNFGSDVAFTMSERFKKFYPYYSLEDVDLSRDQARLPAALVLLQPARDLTEQELRRLDDMVLRGCPMVVFASAVNVRAGDPSMHVALDSFGLNRLLGAYGIDIEDNVLLVRAFTVPDDPLAWTGLARSVRVDESFLPFHGRAIRSIPLASSLRLVPTKQPAAKVEPLIWARGRTDVTPPLSLFPYPRVQTAVTSEDYVVAARVEGTLRSAFDANRVSAPHARVLVVSSSEFLANPFALAGDPKNAKLRELEQEWVRNASAEAPMFGAILDWMTVPNDLAACVAPGH